MNFKKISLAIAVALLGHEAFAQDLTRRIPTQAQAVITLNSKAINDSGTPELWNKLIAKLGFYENEENTEIPLLDNLLDFNKPAYYYYTAHDSLQYNGFLISLKDRKGITNHLLTDYQTLPSINGSERFISPNGDVQVVLNDTDLMVLSGAVVDSYFETDSIAALYGIIKPESVDAAWYDASWEEAEEAEEAATSDEFITYDTIETPLENHEYEEVYEEVISYEEEVVGEAEEYTEVETEDEDSLDYWPSYFLTTEQEQYNDSIKKQLFNQWLDRDIQAYWEPKEHHSTTKAIKIKDKDHLARIWAPNLDVLYGQIMSSEILSMVYNLDMSKIEYGYKEGIFDLFLKENQLQFKAQIGLKDGMAQYLKKVSKSKFNSKMLRYIPNDFIAYASLNASTEQYIKEIPSLMDLMNTQFMYDKEFKIAATAIDIAFDEKAIAKVFRGDNLVIFNDFKEVTTEYVTYEYDDDYNYEEKTEVKVESVPDYLWMFTSTDHRLFKLFFEYSSMQDKMYKENNLYCLPIQNSTEITYFVLKDDLVFIGNNKTQMRNIEQGAYQGNPSAFVKKQIRNNPFSLQFQTAKIPEIAKQLEIPLTSTSSETTEKLSEFGPVNITIEKIKRNTIHSEMTIDLPNSEGNALQFLLKGLWKTTQTLSENNF